jgi:hypothetical protein
MKTNTLSQEISESIKQKAGKGHGVGRIFNHLKKQEKCRSLSELGILRIVLTVMAELGKLPPKSKINYHFRTKVPKDNYDPEVKGEILRDLQNPTPQ